MSGSEAQHPSSSGTIPDDAAPPVPAADGSNDVQVDEEMNLNPDDAPADGAEAEEAAPLPQEAKVPPKKDISLREFLSKMDDYAPIVSHLPTLCLRTNRAVR
jgi:hypothetical protein